MPELPDVERFKRYLDATALHQKIVKVQVTDRRILSGVTQRTLTKRLEGGKLQTTHRHGKHLFVKVDKNGWLRLHFGMTGFLRYYKREDKEPGHARMRLLFGNGFRLAYDNQRRLGEVGWTETPDDYVREEKLGPDALNDLTRERFEEVMSLRRGFVKSVLMNQKAVAGIGNVYADEILFQSRIAPRRRVEKMEAKDRQRLFEALQSVLKMAIDAKADPEKFPEGFLTPHRRKKGHCPRCDGRIEKMTVAGRSGYYCPKCQV